MFSFFKKDTSNKEAEQEFSFNIELIAYALAYEIANADGNIDENELSRIKKGLEKIALKNNEPVEDLMLTIENHSKDSVSFYEFIEDINLNFNKEQKYALISLLWETAYADNVLEVNEERLIRRIADLIRIKDSQVLRLKDKAKQ